ncbi:MAG: hypothetical protein ABII96_09190 [Candidatus Zixiibacteriota bacterium]
MAKTICTKCKTVYETRKKERCPSCNTGPQHSYEFKNSDRYLKNKIPRVHHLAFRTRHIESTFAAVKKDGMGFLIELVGSPSEGLKQTFTLPSKNTFLVTEYIHRYGDFDGFFTKSNVTLLTASTGKQ